MINRRNVWGEGGEEWNGSRRGRGTVASVRWEQPRTIAVNCHYGKLNQWLLLTPRKLTLGEAGEANVSSIRSEHRCLKITRNDFIGEEKGRVLFSNPETRMPSKKNGRSCSTSFGRRRRRPGKESSNRRMGGRGRGNNLNRGRLLHSFGDRFWNGFSP